MYNFLSNFNDGITQKAAFVKGGPISYIKKARY